MIEILFIGGIMSLFFWTVIHFASKFYMQIVCGYFVLSNLLLHALVISMTSHANSAVFVGAEFAAVICTAYLFGVRRANGVIRFERRGWRIKPIHYSAAAWDARCKLKDAQRAARRNVESAA